MPIIPYSPEWVEAKYQELAKQEAERVAQLFRGRGANFGAEKDILARRLGDIRTKLELEAGTQNAAVEQRDKERAADVEERKRREQVDREREERARQDQEEYYRQIRYSQFMQNTPYGQYGQNGYYDVSTGQYVPTQRGFQYAPTTPQPDKSEAVQTTDPNAPRMFYDINKKKRYIRDENGNLIEDTFGIGLPAVSGGNSQSSAFAGDQPRGFSSSTVQYYPRIGNNSSFSTDSVSRGKNHERLDFTGWRVPAVNEIIWLNRQDWEDLQTYIATHPNSPQAKDQNYRYVMNYRLQNQPYSGYDDTGKPIPNSRGGGMGDQARSDYGSDNPNNDLRNKNTNTGSPGGDANPLNWGGSRNTDPDRYDKPQVTGNGEIGLPPLPPPQTDKNHGTTEDLLNEFFNRKPKTPKGPSQYGGEGSTYASRGFNRTYA